jgi:hypothetical protein
VGETIESTASQLYKQGATSTIVQESLDGITSSMGQVGRQAANNVVKFEVAATTTTAATMETNHVENAVNTVKEWGKSVWNYFTED